RLRCRLSGTVGYRRPRLRARDAARSPRVDGGGHARCCAARRDAGHGADGRPRGLRSEPAGSAQRGSGLQLKAAAPGSRGVSMKPRVALGTELLRINRLALGVAVCIVLMAVVVGSFVLGLMDLENTTRVQAKVLADNVSAAILFQDDKSAIELLQSLHHSPKI